MVALGDHSIIKVKIYPLLSIIFGKQGTYHITLSLDLEREQ
jgi:hypothetical protein